MMAPAVHPIEMPYRSLPGLSSRLLADHYELYLGYVKRFRKIEKDLEGALADEDLALLVPLNQESAFLRNAIRLHEIYFEGMSLRPELDPEEVLGKDADRLLREMKLRAMAATGWAILAFDRTRGGFFVNTVEDHADGVVVDAAAIVVCDLWEHAWMPEYGLRKDDYLDAFFDNVCWRTALQRLEEATAILEKT